jgi:hypothetical protein
MTILGVVMDAYLQNATREDVLACLEDAEHRLFMEDLDRTWVATAIHKYEERGYHVSRSEEYQGYKDDLLLRRTRCRELEREIDLLKAILQYTRNENDPLVM